MSSGLLSRLLFSAARGGLSFRRLGVLFFPVRGDEGVWFINATGEFSSMVIMLLLILGLAACNIFTYTAGKEGKVYSEERKEGWEGEAYLLILSPALVRCRHWKPGVGPLICSNFPKQEKVMSSSWQKTK